MATGNVFLAENGAADGLRVDVELGMFYYGKNEYKRFQRRRKKALALLEMLADAYPHPITDAAIYEELLQRKRPTDSRNPAMPDYLAKADVFSRQYCAELIRAFNVLEAPFCLKYTKRRKLRWVRLSTDTDIGFCRELPTVDETLALNGARRDYFAGKFEEVLQDLETDENILNPDWGEVALARGAVYCYLAYRALGRGEPSDLLRYYRQSCLTLEDQVLFKQEITRWDEADRK